MADVGGANLSAEPGHTRLQVWLLGDFEVQVEGRGVGQELSRRSKAGQIVKLLAVTTNHRLHREQVIHRLWPELDGDSGLNNLGRNLFEARRILEPSRRHGASFEFLRLEHNQLVLGAPVDVWIDADAFWHAAQKATDREACEAALRMYRGELLPSDRLTDWTLERRAALHELYVKLLRRTAELQESDGDVDSAIATLEMLISVQRTDEPAHEALMRLVAQRGDRTRAVRLYRHLEETLRADLDTEPGPGARAMLELVLTGRSTPSQSTARVATPGRLQNGTDRQQHPTVEARQPSPTTRPGQLLASVPRIRRPFIGRENELAVACEILQRPEVALLTLTGPGGIGKTRLALETALRLSDAMPDGVHCISLAATTEPDLVFPAIARSLGIPEDLGRPTLDALKAHLRSRQLLLLLDSFEQVTEAGPQLAELLTECPQLKLLVTSRRPLHLSEEYELPVSPLALPDLLKPAPVYELARCPSVALFVERASAVRPGFALSELNAPAVAEICTRLDGLPLAIELAATRIRFLTPEAMLGRLERSLPLLDSGPADLPERHRTLRATTAWSYELLTDEEKRLFRHCAVFVGGFTLQAIEQVCGENEQTERGLLSVLASLVDQSLVWQEEHDGEEPRFSLLQTIREFALEQLEATSEAPMLRQAHAAYYLSLVQEAELKLIAASDKETLDRVEREHDNFRSVFVYALESEDIEPGLLLAGTLRPFWQIRGHMREGMEWLTRLLAASSPDARTIGRAKALNSAGFASVMLGDYQTALQLGGECLSIYRELGEQLGTVEALHHLGLALRCVGDYDASRATFEEALATSRALGHRLWEGRILHGYARTALNAGDPHRSRRLLEAALDCKPEVEDRLARAMSLTDLSDVARSTGDRATAVSVLHESLEIWRSLGHQRGVAQCLESLAFLLSDAAEDDTATYETVVRLLGAAATIRIRIADPSSPYRRGEIQRILDDVRRRLPPSTFELSWEGGTSMSPDELLGQSFYRLG